MKNFIKPHSKHSIFKNMLNAINYDKMINLEMLINDEINELEILNSSLNNFIYI